MKGRFLRLAFVVLVVGIYFAVNRDRPSSAALLAKLTPPAGNSALPPPPPPGGALSTGPVSTETVELPLVPPALTPPPQPAPDTPPLSIALGAPTVPSVLVLDNLTRIPYRIQQPARIAELFLMMEAATYVPPAHSRMSKTQMFTHTMELPSLWRYDMQSGEMAMSPNQTQKPLHVYRIRNEDKAAFDTLITTRDN